MQDLSGLVVRNSRGDAVAQLEVLYGWAMNDRLSCKVGNAEACSVVLRNFIDEYERGQPLEIVDALSDVQLNLRAGRFIGQPAALIEILSDSRQGQIYIWRDRGRRELKCAAFGELFITFSAIPPNRRTGLVEFYEQIDASALATLTTLSERSRAALRVDPRHVAEVQLPGRYPIGIAFGSYRPSVREEIRLSRGDDSWIVSISTREAQGICPPGNRVSIRRSGLGEEQPTFETWVSRESCPRITVRGVGGVEFIAPFVPAPDF